MTENLKSKNINGDSIVPICRWSSYKSFICL